MPDLSAASRTRKDCAIVVKPRDAVLHGLEIGRNFEGKVARTLAISKGKFESGVLHPSGIRKY